jgi:Ni,Fe-hydrogenase III large subunit/Ni,Fe-hydrogenase III component G
MILKELESRLSEAFGANITGSRTENGNRALRGGGARAAPEIGAYVNRELGYPLVSMFASDERELRGGFAVYYVFADRSRGALLILRAPVDRDKPEIRSVSERVHAAALYEREIRDLFGIVPVGHPDARRLVFHGNWPDGEFPLRRDFDQRRRPALAKKETEFRRVLGEGVYEIPVGPVHAGIIEPGHFRFSVRGEPVINLEALLYYVHKGIEKMCEGQSVERCLYISERISGMRPSRTRLPIVRRSKRSPAPGPGPGRLYEGRFRGAREADESSRRPRGRLPGRRLRLCHLSVPDDEGWAYAVADELCGMRFLRSVNRPGGVRKDFVAGKEAGIAAQLKKIRKELEDTAAIVRSNSLFAERLEGTGILRQDIARDLNAVGPGGRASGIGFDVRKSCPYEAFGELEFKVPTYAKGDIACRVDAKIEECFESISLMTQALEKMPAGKVLEPVGSVEPYRFAFGLTEAPRGENIHFVMTGENNTLYRYKVRTPSFCNWPPLCHAVKGNIVPDFPLINKSFNLSYAGNDL